VTKTPDARGKRERTSETSRLTHPWVKRVADLEPREPREIPVGGPQLPDAMLQPARTSRRTPKGCPRAGVLRPDHAAASWLPGEVGSRRGGRKPGCWCRGRSPPLHQVQQRVPVFESDAREQAPALGPPAQRSAGPGAPHHAPGKADVSGRGTVIVYSYRNAFIGSTRAARCAGT
jgi:hypothetical protein